MRNLSANGAAGLDVWRESSEDELRTRQITSSTRVRCEAKFIIMGNEGRSSRERSPRAESLEKRSRKSLKRDDFY